MTALYWHYPGGWPGPFTITITRAADHSAACAAFEVEAHSPTVHVLEAFGRYDSLVGLGLGKVVMIEVERLPSVYDAFALDRGWDYDALEEAGFDLR